MPKKKLKTNVSSEENEVDLGVVYKPTEQDIEATRLVYDEYDYMWENVMNQSYPEMNDRTPAQFWDDSQKRANSYVPSRASQGKEEWQANVFTGTTRNKIRAYVSSVSKEPPQMSITATNKKSERSMRRAEVVKHMIRHSYIAYDNPEMNIFFDGWDCAVSGTVIKYDGLIHKTGKQPIVETFDAVTGEVKLKDDEERVLEDCPIEIEIPLNKFFVRNAYIRDVQEQPAVIRVDWITKDDFELEYGKYSKAKFVKSRAQIRKTREQVELFFGDRWFDRMEDMENKIEVIKFFSKAKNKYIIVADGVPLLVAPMLWGRVKKWYPFTKAIFEPFANSNLFWGNSMPNILMPHQHTEKALHNSMLDKT